MATTNTTDLNKTNQVQLLQTGTDPNSVALGGTTTTGTTTTGTTTTPSAQTYMEAYNQLAQQLTAANNASIAALAEANKTNKQQTSDSYATNARQAYINYAKNQNALKEQLASMGINGGASESAAVNMYNNYAQNVGNNNAARNADLTNLQIEYDQNVANLNNSLAQTLANAQYQAQQNDIARQDTLNSQALEQYATTIERFTTVKSCENEIAKLDPTDPNYQAKKQLLELRIAQINAAKNSSKSGGGTGTGGATGISGGSGDDTQTQHTGALVVHKTVNPTKQKEVKKTTAKQNGVTSKAQDSGKTVKKSKFQKWITKTSKKYGKNTTKAKDSGK